jgi:hypothetical protein
MNTCKVIVRKSTDYSAPGGPFTSWRFGLMTTGRGVRVVLSQKTYSSETRARAAGQRFLDRITKST